MANEQRKFQAPAILNSLSYTKDGGVRLGFLTNELSSADKLIITEFHGKFGYVLFASDIFGDNDVPKEPAPQGEHWSPSRRLRAAVYKDWKAKGTGDFEEYYDSKINQLIAYIQED